MSRHHFFAALILAVATYSANAVIITVPTDQPTIQVAIDIAVDGDEIVVLPGTYFENINYNDKAIAIRSTNGRDVTEINGLITCNNVVGPGTVLEGFTISSTNGGFTTTNSFVGPNITNCKFFNNTKSGPGGAMTIQDSAFGPIIDNCIFDNNHASRQGGAIYSSMSNPIITNCVFSGNSSTGGAGPGSGGAMYIVGLAPTGAPPEVTNCTFTNNMTGTNLAKGGAVFGHGVFTNCQFLGNTSTGAGGGMFYNSQDVMTLTDCTFIGNISGRSGGGFRGSFSGSEIITGCTFIDNVATVDNGGGISNSGVTTDSTFCRNQPFDIENGGLMSNISGCDPCPADIDGDGIVGVPDLLTLLAAWGACPSPKGS